LIRLFILLFCILIINNFIFVFTNIIVIIFTKTGNKHIL
jgi:hypothetical protein